MLTVINPEGVDFVYPALTEIRSLENLIRSMKTMKEGSIVFVQNEDRVDIWAVNGRMKEDGKQLKQYYDDQEPYHAGDLQFMAMSIKQSSSGSIAGSMLDVF